MTNRQRLSSGLAIGLLALITIAGPAAARRNAGPWTSLGELHVKDRVDRDTLRLTSEKGTFDAIRLKVKGRAVQFHSLTIHFENGTEQEVALRSVIRPRKFSRVIDLTGGQRALEKIVFVYDAQTRQRGKGAKIEVFARR